MRPNRYYQGPISAHFDGFRFFNPGLASTDKRLGDMLRWRWQSRGLPRWTGVPVTKPATVPALSQAVRVTAIGHASALIQMADYNLLVDPVWSDRIGPIAHFGPRRWNAAGIAFDQLPPIHAVLITHNHYDHLDLPTLKKLHASHTFRLLTPLGNNVIIQRAIPSLSVTCLDWWQADRFDHEALTITLTPAYHWSARGLRDRRMALWGGFYLQTPQARVYIAGDTAFGAGQYFRQIHARLGPPDLAILPIGAYAPRWFMQSVHMNPDEAVQAMQLLEARRALGCHWGTFRLTDEAVDEPVDALANALTSRGLATQTFEPLYPGQSIVFADKAASGDEAC